VETLSAVEARRLAVAAQGLSTRSFPRGSSPGGVLRFLGAVQLDTISVLARSHELVPYARLGACGRPAVEAAFWSTPAVAFEYWAHAACVLPIESWPLYGATRRRLATGRPRSPTRVQREVLAALRDRGPLTATDLGGAKKGGPWWDWSEVKIAAEDLFRWGEVVVTRRDRWRRVYDLPSRAIPPDLLGRELSDEACDLALVEKAGSCLGVATAGDLAGWVGRLPVAAARTVAASSCLVPVTVAGWAQPAWAHPSWLAALSEGSVPSGSRTTLLSPFDSLLWSRERMERVFGMRHRLEAYVPRPLREHGYFAMPVLAGGRLVARVDPARSGSTLVARHVTFASSSAVPAVARALREAATWVGSSAIAVERVTPPALRPALEAAVR
jgi:uncharacterized protein YcaQ